MNEGRINPRAITQFSMGSVLGQSLCAASFDQCMMDGILGILNSRLSADSVLKQVCWAVLQSLVSQRR